MEQTLKLMFTPVDAIHTLKRHLHGVIWFKGATLVGVGPHAVIDLATISPEEAQRFIDGHSGKWNGYKLRARRYSE